MEESNKMSTILEFSMGKKQNTRELARVEQKNRGVEDYNTRVLECQSWRV